MKLAIISDTHGNYPLAIRAIEAREGFDHIIHLGDNIDDAWVVEDAIGQEIIKVPGNCDFVSTLPRELTQDFAGKLLFVSHGDRYRVKEGLARLVKKAASTTADIVLFGHTHAPLVEEINNTLFINPGSLAQNCPVPSFAILSIVKGVASAEIITLDH